MAIGDVWRIQVGAVGGQGNQPMQFHLHYRQNTGTILQDPAEDLRDAWKASCEAELLDLMSTSYAINEYKVRLATDPTIGGNFPQTLAQGLLTGEQLMAQQNMFLNFKTAKFGRSYRGGIHLFPMTEAVMVEGLWASSLLTGVAEFTDTLFNVGDGITTALYTLGIWSVKRQEFNPVTGINPSLIPAALQSRKPRA